MARTWCRDVASKWLLYYFLGNWIYDVWLFPTMLCRSLESWQTINGCYQKCYRVCVYSYSSKVGQVTSMAAHCDFIAGVTAGTYASFRGPGYLFKLLMDIVNGWFFRCVQYVHVTPTRHSENEYAIGEHAIYASSQNAIQNRRSELTYSARCKLTVTPDARSAFHSRPSHITGDFCFHCVQPDFWIRLFSVFMAIHFDFFKISKFEQAPRRMRLQLSFGKLEIRFVSVPNRRKRSRSFGSLMYSWRAVQEACWRRHSLVQSNCRKFDCKSKQVNSALFDACV